MIFIAVRLLKIRWSSCEKVELRKPEAGPETYVTGETYITGERTPLNHLQVMVV